MITEFSANGAIAYWDLVSTPRKHLEKAFAASGFIKYTPTQRSPHVSLKRAANRLAYHIATTALPIVLPRAKRAGHTFDFFDVDSSNTNAPANVTPIATVSVNDPWHTPQLSLVGDYCDVANHGSYERELQSKYAKLRSEVDSSALNHSLVNCLTDMCHATPLRPRGALYWIPDRHVDAWRKLVDAICEGSDNNLHVLTVRNDKDLLIAVKKAITNEITSEVKSITNMPDDKQLGKRARETKEQLARKLKLKVNEYEQIVGETLTGLTAACDFAKMIIVEKSLTNLSNL